MDRLIPGPVRVSKYLALPSFDNEVDYNDGRPTVKRTLARPRFTYMTSDDVVVDNEVNFDMTEKSGDYDKYDDRGATPYYLDPYNFANFAIFMAYFVVGIVSRSHQTPVAYYLIYDLDCSSTEYSAYNTLHRLPWSIKPIFGMLSDGIPILGYRRKPWLLIGWITFSMINIYLASLGEPGVNETIFGVMLFTCSMALADVCCDTLCVERAQFEADDKKGSFQNIGFIFRGFGRIVGSILGAFLFENGTTWSFTISQIFILQAVIPIVLMSICIWQFIEISYHNFVPSFSEQVSEVWRVLQLRAVWHPMIFIYTFNVLQIPNGAWNNFLVYSKGFDDEELGYLTITAAVVGMIAYWSFKQIFFDSNWRYIYLGTSLISFFFSSLQIILILGLNKKMGLPDLAFAIGDEAIIALMEGLHAMPTVIMFVMLCPHGAEGTTFALLTTISSLAGTVASDLGTVLTSFWDVSNTSLADGMY